MVQHKETNRCAETVPIIQKIQNTVEILQTQFIPDVTQNRVPIIQEIQKTVEIPRAQFMPVMTHDRCLRLKRPCSSHVFRTL